MSGSARMTSSKDGIFGRFIAGFDGTNFVRLLASSAGRLLIENRPSAGYISNNINSIVSTSYDTGNQGVGNYNQLIYTVPTNYILRITYVENHINVGGASIIRLLCSIKSNNMIVNNINTPVVAASYELYPDIYLDEADTINGFMTVTVNPTVGIFKFAGYLIPKT